MAEDSNIEWTDHTFNPWIGCSKVSAGCKHCYAETLMDKRYGRVEWGPNGKRVRTSEANWKKPLQWNKKAEKLGVRHKVFCASLADVFEVKDDQPEMDEWRADLFNLIKDTPNLDWLLLTKRPENARDFLNAIYQDEQYGLELLGEPFMEWFIESGYPFLPNVWIGTSVENQEQADKRVIELLKIPTAVRFLSMEPLLGPVDLHLAGTIPSDISPNYMLVGNRIDWIIVGGESGNGARPMDSKWVRGIQSQCFDFDIPFFFKQWGEWCPADQVYTANAESNVNVNKSTKPFFTFDDGDFSYKLGKKASGRVLDGKIFSEFPESRWF